MHCTRAHRWLLAVVMLVALTGSDWSSAAAVGLTPSHLPGAASPCQWAPLLPTWLTGPPATPDFAPTVARPSPGVHYAQLPTQAYRVLVDQPTGTIFALSDNGAMFNSFYDSGLLSVLQGATHTPPAWFPTTPPANGNTYLLGTAVPVADGRGQVYFTCGGDLYQLGPDGRPQIAPVPMSGSSMAVDEAAHRLFTLADLAGSYLLGGFDTRTGKQLVDTAVNGASANGGPLAVDARGGRLYFAGSPVNQNGEPSPATLYVLSLQGRLLATLPGFGAFQGQITQLVLAGITRRLVVFGCLNSTPAGPAAELVQILNLTSGRYLTPKPLALGACGTGYGGSLLTALTPGILAVDAVAGTALVLAYPAEGPNSSWPPQPGFAWFVDLRTGGWLHTNLPYGCVQVGRWPTWVAIDSRLHRAYVASGVDGLVTILDTRTAHVLGVVHVGGIPTSIAVDTHDQQVVVALEGVPGQMTTPGGVAFFPANITTAQVPPTRGCAAEGAPFFLAPGPGPSVPVP